MKTVSKEIIINKFMYKLVCEYCIESGCATIILWLKIHFSVHIYIQYSTALARAL